MGKKGGIGYGINKKPPPTSGLLQHGKSQATSLRQQSGRGGGPATALTPALNPSNQVTALRADHLLRIATWASANVPPLGALLGARLGCLCEAAGVPVPDTPHSICERCESIMQVGVNCSVRVTKNKKKGKSSNISNSVTHICHFCKHGNAKPGTSKNHLKTKIAQAAARSNLNFLGNSSVAETRRVNKQTLPLNLTKEKQQGPAEEERSVQICLKNHQGSTEKEGPDAVNTTLDVALEGRAEEEGSKAVELSLEKGSSDLMETSQRGSAGQESPEAVEMKGHLDLKEKNEQEFAEQEGARTLGVTLDKEPLITTEKNQPERESAKAVEVILDEGPSGVTEKKEQGFTQQEGPKPAEVILDEGPSGVTEKKEQGFTQQDGPKPVEVNLNEGPLDHTGKEQGFAEQEGLKSTGMGLNKLPLDLLSKKKRKKKNQQDVVEQEGPKMSPHNGLAVERSDSAKKKKRKGWSTLKELASLP